MLEDAGLTVNEWLHLADTDPSVPLANILADSGRALANLHRLKLYHGRPALRDIGWQDGVVKFIDLEASSRGYGELLRPQVWDLLVYTHSLFRYLGPEHPLIERAIEAYRHGGGEAVWQAARVRLQKWQWLQPLLRPFRRVGGRDLKPVFWVLWHFSTRR